ncbi:MAG: VOC family protein [Actinomycetota bacterium]|nr:VOC family protein [Actinomycetota bacterium]
MPNPVVRFEVIGDAPDPGPVTVFYTSLFGWKVSPMPGEFPYYTVDTGTTEGITGGIGAAPGKTMVTFYVQVDDLQATLDRAEELGGTTVQPVTVVVPEMVSIANLADPQGNIVGLISAPPPEERTDSGGRHPVVHFEILATDGRAAKDFWVNLFGWKFRDVETMNYSLIDAEEGGIPGGIGHNPSGGNQVAFYVRADDLQTTLNRAGEIGGRIISPPMSVPNGPRLAHFSDPQGNLIGLVGPGE